MSCMFYIYSNSLYKYTRGTALLLSKIYDQNRIISVKFPCYTTNTNHLYNIYTTSTDIV